MRVARVLVRRFEALEGLERELPRAAGPDLVVVLGPNEAGKSTLVRFLHAILFPGDRGGAVDGEVDLEDGAARYRVAQRGAARTHTVVELGTGTRFDEASWHRLVGGLDRRVYRNVFAFGLDELADVRTLDAEEVQQRLLSAAVTGAGRSVLAAQRALEERLAPLHGPRKAGRLVALAERLAQAQEEVERAQQEARAYQTLHDEEVRLAEALREAEAELREAEAALRRTEILLELQGRWRARRQALRELAASPAVDDLPADALGRAERLEEKLRQAERRVAELVREAEAWDANAPVPPHPALLAVQEAVEGLAAELAAHRRAVEETLPALEAEVAAAEGELTQRLAALGPGWDEARLAAQSLPAGLEAEARAHAEALAEVRRVREEAVRAREEARRAAEAAAARHAARARGAEEAWAEARPRLEALQGQAALYRQQRTRAAELRREAAGHRAAWEAALGRLGPAWDAERLRGFADYEAWRQQAQQAAERLAAAEGVLRYRQAAARGGPTDAPPPPVPEAEAAWTRAREAVLRLEALERAFDEAAAARQDAERALEAWVRARAAVGRGWLTPALAVGLSLGLAAWAFRRDPGLAVALVALAAVLGWATWPRGGAGEAGRAAQAAWRRAEERAAGAEEALRAAAAAAGLPAEGLTKAAVFAALQAARDTLDGAAALRERARGWAEAAAAAAEVEGAWASWRAWLESKGLPPTLAPGNLEGFLDEVRQGQDAQRAEDRAAQEARLLEEQVEAWEAEVRALAAALGRTEVGPPEEVLAACAAAVAAGEDVRAARGEAERAAEALAVAEDRVRTLEADLEDREAAWRVLRDAHGLPGHLDPAPAEDWIRAFRAAEAARARLEGLRQVWHRERARTEAWLREAAAVLARAGRAVPEAPPARVAALDELARDVQAAGEAEQAVRRHAEGRQDLAHRLEAARAEAEAARTALAEALAAAGAADLEELRQRVGWQAQRAEWRRLVREVEDELERRVGREREAFAGALDEDDPLRWEREREGLVARVEALRRRLDDPDTGLRAELARVQERRRFLEESADVAAAQAGRAAREAELRQALRAWLVGRLADRLLRDTLDAYRRAHVPEVLRAAGRRLALVTGERYREVLVPEGDRFAVHVWGPRTGTLAADRLSRGTREQLYLVLRLGLADSFARQSRSLPLLLDDCLVNADRERRRALAHLLADAAGTHQVVVFTCHEETVEALREAAPGVPVVELPQLAARATAEPEPTEGAASSGGDLEAELVARLRGRAEGWSLAELAEALGRPREDVGRALERLVADGRVARHGRTRGTRYAWQGDATGEG